MLGEMDCSPDLNPMELCWSKFKSLLQHAEARTRGERDDAIAEAMKAITPGSKPSHRTICVSAPISFRPKTTSS
jgi:hypothetical protein